MTSANAATEKPHGNRNAAVLATLCAGVMIAFQTASKVIRDTLFFESFDVTALPTVVICAAVASVAFAIPVGRFMRVLSPARVIPSGFIISAILLVIEWTFTKTAPKVAAIAVYLHFAALGAVLISGFWSLINERFDPHSAKMYVSRIAGGATLGGLIGGIIAERLSGVLDAAAVLFVLAGFHVLCAIITWYITRHHRPSRRGEPRTDEAGRTAVENAVRPGDATRADGENESMLTGLATVGRVAYLRNLAGLVLVTTTASGLLDYLFKAAAVAEFVEKADRQRFFAIFYTGSSLATFLIQALFGSRMLQRFGIAVTMGTLPVIAGIGSVLNVVFPGVWSATFLRGGEMAMKSSLFRAGYEQHYAPIPPHEKRSAKSVIDVVVDRIGDAVGGGLIALFLMLGNDVDRVVVLMLGIAVVVLYAIAIFITGRLRAGYVQAVEKSLLERAIDLEAIDSHTRARVNAAASPYDSLKNANIDGLSRASINMSMQSLQSIQPVPPQAAMNARLGTEHNATTDQIVAVTADLRSRDKARVKRALKSFTSIDRPPVQIAIPLLAWDDVAPSVVKVLRHLVDRHCGSLLDALFDEEEEFTVRRRIPRVLSAATDQRAVDGLLVALSNRRFEIRYRAAVALVQIRSRAPKVTIKEKRIFALVQEAVDSDARVSASRTIVDRLPDDEAPMLGEVLEERSDRGLEHVFNLLSLVLDPQHVRIAYQGIHTDDPSLHGLALEYLDSVLPEDLREGVMKLVMRDEKAKAAQRGDVSRDQRQVVEDLLRSRESIVMNLAALRKDTVRNVDRETDTSK